MPTPDNNIAAATTGLNPLLLLLALLLTFGLVMMTSASAEIASAAYGDPFYYLKRQLLFASLGLCATLAAMCLPLHWWQENSGRFLLIALVLLLLVLVPGIGYTVNGSTRWIDLGIFRLQPSELAKPLLVLYLAAFIARRPADVQHTWGGFLRPLMVIGLLLLLLHFESDYGAMVIALATGLCMLFLAGVKLHRFATMMLFCVAGVLYLATTRPYMIDRLKSFLDPWSAEFIYASGYQLTQAQIAFGRGGWTGMGLGNSIQKLYFLPEAHNDFVLAIIGEELGLAGVLALVLLFALLVYKALAVGRAALRQGAMFTGFLACGIGMLFAFQSLINAGVSTGILPTKGLTLPFISYGGASLAVSCLMVGLLLRAEYETCIQPTNRRPPERKRYTRTSGGVR